MNRSDIRAIIVECSTEQNGTIGLYPEQYDRFIKKLIGLISVTEQRAVTKKIIGVRFDPILKTEVKLTSMDRKIEYRKFVTQNTTLTEIKKLVYDDPGIRNCWIILHIEQKTSGYVTEFTIAK